HVHMRALLVAMTLACAMSALARAASFEERVAPCLACHGEKGTSALPDIPSLGAQPAPYVLIQLFLFRNRQRIVDVMNDATKAWPDEALRTSSDYIAKRPRPEPAAAPTDIARLAKGATLVRQYRCDFCHNPDLAGRDNVPRLAGQRED